MAGNMVATYIVHAYMYFLLAYNGEVSTAILAHHSVVQYCLGFVTGTVVLYTHSGLDLAFISKLVNIKLAIVLIAEL